MAEQWKLFYDGGCNLCHVSQLRLEKWAESAGQAVSVEILQSPEAIEKGYGEGMVLEVDGKAFIGSEAWLRTQSVWPWYLKPLVIVPKPILRWGYGVVARFRYRLFGRRSCPIPQK
jgi:predicted DCC family thiol-disulfide oxidoreductase YuxK